MKRNKVLKNGQSVNSNEIEMQNMKHANEMVGRFQTAGKDLSEVHGITTNINVQLDHQGEILKGIKSDAKEAQSELTMADQIMRIIKNRNLKTKLILIIFMFFMAGADLMLFITKLS